MGSIFRFKQFSVDQGNCAMKINTDGVLLGGIAQSANAARILDIGTGTGVIAMMLAQSHPLAQVDAVEIDPDAAEQAAENFRNAPFANRLRLVRGSFKDMRPAAPYDLMVSNPPFYTNSLHAPDPRRNLAKHTDKLFFEDLFNFVVSHLADAGHFLCIVPPALAGELATTVLPPRKLYVHEELIISSYPAQDAIRTLLTIGRREVPNKQDHLHIYESKGLYSERYKEILEPYFLAF